MAVDVNVLLLIKDTSAFELITNKISTINPDAPSQYRYTSEKSVVDYVSSYINSQVTPIQTDILQLIYPVGSLYITTLNYCPLATIGVGTWQKVGEGRVLQMANSSQSANNTIEAGLPNITGDFKVYPSAGGGGFANGAFSMTNNRYDSATRAASADNWSRQYDFNASRSSAIYGRSNTVQPPAYLVNTFRRAS